MRHDRERAFEHFFPFMALWAAAHLAKAFF